MIRAIVFSTLVLCACASSDANQAAEPTTDSTAEPTSGAENAAPSPGAIKCAYGGGSCVSKVAATDCSRFEEGPSWGCGDGEGCCMR
jgi:hypothetical protein